MRIVDWNACSDSQRDSLMMRPSQLAKVRTRSEVEEIIALVRRDGDRALAELTQRFDGVAPDPLQVPPSQWRSAETELPAAMSQAIDRAYEQISKFHRACIPQKIHVETCEGVTCEIRSKGIRRVGLYVPGGQTPLPSTILMLGVPAQLAGCPDIVVCCAPGPQGTADAAVLRACQRCGIGQVFLVGGAQAIAAMAYGTETIPACDKLFGPGNAWVTEAKRQVSVGDRALAIDMLAGPSEVLVIADGSADFRFVAADLLSQAEHGPDSQAFLITTSEMLATQVRAEVMEVAEQLPRRAIVEQSLLASSIILVKDLQQAVALSNAYAPEHLLLQTDQATELAKDITAVGSVFLGHWTPEVLGDYCSGTNHVLPTGGYARSINGLCVTDFMKRMTVQSATPEGLCELAETAETFAKWEGLEAHRQAVATRRQTLELARP